MNKVILGIVGLVLLLQSTQGADWKPAEAPTAICEGSRRVA